jgi:hypothetical protein
MTDLEIIAAVDALTRDRVNALLPRPGLLRRLINFVTRRKPPGTLPKGAQCHRSRVGAVRAEWQKAREAHFRETGVDVLDAIKRHEAWLRNPQNAPELHVERR